MKRAVVIFAIAHIVQGGFGRQAQRIPHPVGDQRVKRHAFIHFVEMRQRRAVIKQFASAVLDRRAIDIVEQAFRQVGGGREIFQALLILDAHRVAAESIGDAQGRDIHFALLQHLRLGEVGLPVAAVFERHAFLDQPVIDGARFRVEVCSISA